MSKYQPRINHQQQFGWDGINEMQIQARAQLDNAKQTPAVVRARLAEGHDFDIARTTVLLETVSKDILTFQDELNDIYRQHMGKTGRIRSDEQRFLSIQIAEQYSDWQMRFQNVILPTLGDLATALSAKTTTQA